MVANAIQAAAAGRPARGRIVLGHPDERRDAREAQEHRQRDIGVRGDRLALNLRSPEDRKQNRPDEERADAGSKLLDERTREAEQQEPVLKMDHAVVETDEPEGKRLDRRYEQWIV